MIDEGYIKFSAIWEEQEPLPKETLTKLIDCRDKMYQHGLIGAYPNGIGFGNISIRWKNSHDFIISGSATGGIPRSAVNHYTHVYRVDIEENRLFCQGPVVASSESMSHAAIYKSRVEVQSIIHVHHLELWKNLLRKVPTTPEDVASGTPEMAYALMDLLKPPSDSDTGIIAMEGHREGIIVYGPSLAGAANYLLQITFSMLEHKL